MKRGKSFDNLLTDLHSEPLPDSAMPLFAGQSEGVLDLAALTETETERLVACETTIANGLDTFLAVGNALLDIQRGKLYRSSHRTFEGYCRERFQLKRQRAYELMGAAEVVNSLSEISDKLANLPLPTRESHANALADLPLKTRRDVWAEVAQDAERRQKSITASQIKTTIGRHKKVGEANPIPAVAGNPLLVKKIKKAATDVATHEIRLEVTGNWLQRHGLEDAWRDLRNRPEWVINHKFTDSLSLEEARLLGIVR